MAIFLYLTKGNKVSNNSTTSNQTKPSSKYNPKEVEANLYTQWSEKNYFDINSNEHLQKQNTAKNKNFAIMMPPPNVTGVLHIGHALTYTLQDIIVRYKRMDGFKVLWQVGADHAGIATQKVVLDKLKKEKNITKNDLNKEEFLKYAWEWKEYSGGEIFKQMRALGISPSWDRMRFSLDEGLACSVKKAFVSLYNEGLIYKGLKLVNWDPSLKTAISDLEVVNKAQNGSMYYVKYPIKDTNEHILVATTRPETILADSALAINPNDDRHKHLIGKDVVVPLTNRVIKVIADEYVDGEFGTGCVKITPAHDYNDYEVGQRHNLDMINLFDDDAKMNENANKYKGLDRFDAREAIIRDLKQEGLLQDVQPHSMNVPINERTGVIVEPYLTNQWFVKASKVAKNSIEQTKANNMFFPKSWINSYNAWMDNLNDWCISRQLWWGHGIPVFYCKDCSHEFASEEDASKCAKCGSSNIFQDEDVLDTWFSSALWPFSTLGWSNGGKLKHTYKDSDLDEFYPNSLLITGFDILFFWVARMMMMGEHFMGKLPFKDIYLHALVKDEFGAKMSKSKGNVINPLDMIDEFSADVVRFSLCYLCVQGRDIKLGKKHLEVYRNFTNKLHNACNYLLIHQDSFKDLEQIEIKSDLGLYMLSRLNDSIAKVRACLDEYKFNEAAGEIYSIVWLEFCDKAIEYSKVSPQSIGELGSIFKEILKLTSPFMPFISDNLYTRLSGSDYSSSLTISAYPKANKSYNFKEQTAMFDVINEAITSIRRLKVNANMANAKIDLAYIKFNDDKLNDKKWFDNAKMFIQKLAKVGSVGIFSSSIKDKSLNENKKILSDVSDNLQTYLPQGEDDTKDAKNKLELKKEKLQKELEKIDNLLSNDNFVKNAPKEVIEKNTTLAQTLKENIAKLNEQICQL